MIKRWTIVRLALIAAAFLSSTLAQLEPAQADPAPGWFLLIVFVFGIVGLLVVVGVQRMNPLSASLWRYPGWSINPFQLREPLQFFHFAACLMVASGAGLCLHMLYLGAGSRTNEALPLVFGLGALCGVRACTLVYKNKMVSEKSSEGT